MLSAGRKFTYLVVALALIAVCPKHAFAQEPNYTIKIVSDPWNTLEAVKLGVGLLIPAAMLFVGVWMDRRIKEFEHRQWSNQKVIEKRLEVYEKITPGLNEIMCYFMRLGTWKTHDPKSIVNMKRDIDKIAHIYAPLFSPKFLQNYYDFMGVCFSTFRGAGLDAQLRTECEHYQETYIGGDGKWNADWDDCFTGKEGASEQSDVRAAYQGLVGLIARELGVGLEVSEEEEKQEDAKQDDAK